MEKKESNFCLKKSLKAVDKIIGLLIPVSFCKFFLKTSADLQQPFLFSLGYKFTPALYVSWVIAFMKKQLTCDI